MKVVRKITCSNGYNLNRTSASLTVERCLFAANLVVTFDVSDAIVIATFTSWSNWHPIDQ
jgi:hypothetical protein